MAVEIERKFLVKGNYKAFATERSIIKQGFLSSVPERVVRIRIVNNQGFITVKGIGNKSGTTRFEWEKEIAVEDAADLLAICEPEIIEKIRHIIPISQELRFEVDEFLGKNKGLVIAEIELLKENTIFAKPDWLSEEVTGQIKYYNVSLSKNPFTTWRD